jgi:proline iminopeptidase
MRIGLAGIVALVVVGGRAWAADPPGKTFDGPGGKIWYEVRGSGTGRPLIVVNGGPGFDHTYLDSSNVWDKLARNRRVVTYDQRGMGRSYALAPGAQNTLEEQIADLDALRAQLGTETIDLLGHSYGGYLSMAYTARNPQRVAHLMLLDSAAPKWSETIFLFNQVYPESIERQNSLGFASELGDKSASDATIKEYLGTLFYSPEKRDAFLKLWNPAAFKREVNAALDHDLARYDLNPEIRKFKMPTLVMTGRFDMNVAPLTAYKMSQAIPGARFRVFEKSGHLPFLEEPDAFAAAVEDFLKR